MPKKNEPEWMKKGREKSEKVAKDKVEKTQKEIQEILDEANKKKNK